MRRLFLVVPYTNGAFKSYYYKDTPLLSTKVIFVKQLLITLFFTLFCYVITSCQIIGLDLMQDKDEIRIPFDMEQGFIIVDVTLDGIVPLRMIFDTGAENTILFDKELADLVNLDYERSISITGSDLDSVIEASITRNVKMKLTSCSQVERDIIVLERNNFLLREKLGFEVNGIVGGSFFANLIVKINYNKKRIHFYRPSKFDEDLSKYNKLKLDIISNKPYLSADIATASLNTVKAKLLIDTGAALPFLLHANTDTNIVIPDRTMLGTVGFGLSGPVRGFLGKTDYLTFGEYTFENIITSYQDIFSYDKNSSVLKRNGIIGNILLKRFDIVIDYTKEYIYLKAKRKYDREFAYDKSGINVLAFGPELNQFMISSVINGSPSAEAGLKPGDVIIKVNGRVSRNLSLQGITNLMSDKSGKKIRFVIMREEEQLKKEFRLQDWYLPTGSFGF